MNQPRKRRKPIGSPITRTDAELDALVNQPPTPAELNELRAKTARVSPLLALLMDAKEDDNAAANPDA